MKNIVIILLATLLTTIAGCSSEPVAFLRGKDIAAADQAPISSSTPSARPGRAIGP